MIEITKPVMSNESGMAGGEAARCVSADRAIDVDGERVGTIVERCGRATPWTWRENREIVDYRWGLGSKGTVMALGSLEVCRALGSCVPWASDKYLPM